MDFTEIYPQSNFLVEYSPGTQFLLTAKSNKLIVRRAHTLQITRVWDVDSAPGASSSSNTLASEASSITHIGWSSDSEYVLAACAKRNFVQVYKLRDESWSARIESGVEGLVRVTWAPDGRSILCFSEWGLRVTVWSLVTGVATYIQYPRNAERGWAFRQDGRYFVLAERHKSKDMVGVYDVVHSFKLVKHFQLPTSTLSSIAFCPRGTYLAVWENALDYKLFILTLTGRVVASFTPETGPGLGIRSAVWHPGGAFLAVGGWDSKVYLLDNVSWQPVACLDLLSRSLSDVVIWREPHQWFQNAESLGFFSYERAKNTAVPRPNWGKPQSQSGLIQLDWNVDGSFLLARLENIPTAVFIVEIPEPAKAFRPRLHTVLLHEQPVSHSRWNPVRSGSLVMSCGTGGMYLWSHEWVSDGGDVEDVAECVSVPSKGFLAQDIRWSPDGTAMILLEKENFCCAIEVIEQD